MYKIRLNPGNISDRVQVEAVIDACKDRGIPIRIGVNEGSIIERRDNKFGPRVGPALQRAPPRQAGFDDRKLEEYLDIFHAKDFHDLAIAKHGHHVDGGRVHRDRQTVRLPVAPWRDPRRPQRDRMHSLGRRPRFTAPTRHR